MPRDNIMKVIVFLLMAISGCGKTDHISLWDRHCGACHDGQTILNGKVVMDKEQMKVKYKTYEEFADACSHSPSCMNIMKHEKKLFADVGKEIGIKESPK